MRSLGMALRKLRDARDLGAFAGARILTQAEAAAVLDALHLITRVAEADVNMSGTAIDSELDALIREAADILKETR